MEGVPQKNSPESKQERKLDDHDVGVKNKIQLLLAERYGEGDLLEFIHKHSEDIARIFDTYEGLYDYYDDPEKGEEMVMEYVAEKLGFIKGPTLH